MAIRVRVVGGRQAPVELPSRFRIRPVGRVASDCGSLPTGKTTGMAGRDTPECRSDSGVTRENVMKRNAKYYRAVFYRMVWSEMVATGSCQSYYWAMKFCDGTFPTSV